MLIMLVKLLPLKMQEPSLEKLVLLNLLILLFGNKLKIKPNIEPIKLFILLNIVIFSFTILSILNINSLNKLTNKLYKCIIKANKFENIPAKN